MSGVEVTYEKEDARPAFPFAAVQGADLSDVNAMHAAGVPAFLLKDVSDFGVHLSRTAPDTRVEKPKGTSF